MSHYPVMLKIEGWSALIVGGGLVALRKLKPLLAAGAVVTVISPEISEEMASYVENGAVTWYARSYESGDEEGMRLVVAATNDPMVNQAIAERATDGQLVNVVTDPALGNFQVPAMVRRGKLTIAVSTDGASPLLAKHIQQTIDQQFDPDYGRYVDFLAECRERIKQDTVTSQDKKRLLKVLLDPIYQDPALQQEVLTHFETFKKQQLFK